MIRTGTICASYLYKYFTTEDNSGDDNDDGEHIKFKKKKFKIKCLSDVFADCGGILSKISQIINMDYDDYENTVFSECKPYNPEKTLEFIKKQLSNEQYKDKIFDFDFNAYKSGSIGQVHKAKNINGDDIVMKVQYSGLYEQFKIDINIFNNVSRFLFDKLEMKDVLNGIEEKLYQELDYELEVKNHNLIYDIWKDNEYIKITDVINDLCSEKIITLKCIDGEILSSFVNNSTQEEKNFIATKIFEFVFTTLFKNKLFYSDIHYGNFLVKDKNILYVMDFGCISEIDDELLHNLKLLYKSLYDGDDDLFYAIAEDLNILTDKITSDEDIKFLLDKFKIILQPLLYKGIFNFNDDEWTKEFCKYNSKTEDWGLLSDLVLFAKIPFGLFPIFVKMKININFSEILLKIIEEN